MDNIFQYLAEKHGITPMEMEGLGAILTLIAFLSRYSRGQNIDESADQMLAKNPWIRLSKEEKDLFIQKGICLNDKNRYIDGYNDYRQVIAALIGYKNTLSLR